MSDQQSSTTPTQDSRGAITAFLSAAFLTLVLWNAWYCDDAFVTFRTVDNFVRGYGLRWNILERVQGFTHPLWALLISAVYFFTHEIFYTVFAVSAALALFTVWTIAGRIAVSAMHAVVVVLFLCLSHAVVEYSTSGLENVLTHALLASLALAFFSDAPERTRFQRVMCVSGLLVLNRMDTVWLAITPAIYSGWRAYRAQVRLRRLIGDALLGVSPFLIWLAFALIYFGFPFPNTAYAKLNTGISVTETWYQGVLYGVSLLNSDPISVFCILVATLLALRRGTPAVERAWLLGALLYCVYTTRVGGDFMQGRFFAAPVVVAAISIARAWLPLQTQAMQLAAVGALLVVALSIPSTPPIINRTRGVSDERGHYFKSTSLLAAKRASSMPDHDWMREGAQAQKRGRKAITRNVIGMFGYSAGPHPHIVDLYALTDPLLARIPAKRDVGWRIGHFARVVPKGYLETLDTGQPRIRDKNLNRYYAALRQVIAGPIWSWSRWVAIWQLNTGALDHLIDHDQYRHPTLLKVALSAVAQPFKRGTDAKATGVRKLSSSGLEITLDGVKRNKRIELSLDANDQYEIVYIKGLHTLATQDIAASHLKGLDVISLTTPARAVDVGFDRLRIYPVKGRDFRFGHLLLK